MLPALSLQHAAELARFTPLETEPERPLGEMSVIADTEDAFFCAVGPACLTGADRPRGDSLRGVSPQTEE